MSNQKEEKTETKETPSLIQSLKKLLEQPNLSTQCKSNVEKTITSVEKFLEFFQDCLTGNMLKTTIVKNFTVHRKSCQLWMRILMKQRTKHKRQEPFFRQIQQDWIQFERELLLPAV